MGFRGRFLTLLALAVGAAPGFLLPIVITWKLPLLTGAALLLSVSLTQIAYNAVGAAYETTVLVRLGSLYGSTESPLRIAFRPLVTHSVTRIGPVVVGSSGLLVFGAGVLSPDLDPEYLALVTTPLSIGLIVQIAATSFTAHLYASRRLPSVYLGNVFLGGPSVICALVWQDAIAVAVVYAIGQALRWVFLAWRVRVSGRGLPTTDAVLVSPPSWRELSPQFLASSAGQAMPLLVQSLLAIAGAQAVAIGSIALRIWGAAWQVATSTIAMPETVTLTRTLPHLERADRRRWLDKQAARVVIATTGLTAVGFGLIALISSTAGHALPPAVLAGLTWSVAALLGLPGGMLGFWAGRGLVAVHEGRWLPLMIVVAFVVGAVTCILAVPSLGGYGAMVAQACAFSAQGVATYLFLRYIGAKR